MTNSQNEGTGKDFDFHGSTAKVANAIHNEQVLYQGARKPTKGSIVSHQQQQQQKQLPQREQPKNQSSYTKPKNEIPQQIPDLKPEMSLWQTTSGKQVAQLQSHLQTQSQSYSQPRSSLAQAHYQHIEQRATPPPQSVPPVERKFMSLEEVEAQILARNQNRAQVASQPGEGRSPVPPAAQPQYSNQAPQFSHPPSQQQQQQPPNQFYNPELDPRYLAQQRLRHDVPSAQYPKPPLPFDQKPTPPPQSAQSFPQHPGMPMMLGQPGFNQQFQSNQRQQQYPGNVSFPINNLGTSNVPAKAPAELTDEERQELLLEEQKRMKRNAKIAQLVSITIVFYTFY